MTIFPSVRFQILDIAHWQESTAPPQKRSVQSNELPSTPRSRTSFLLWGRAQFYWYDFTSKAHPFVFPWRSIAILTYFCSSSLPSFGLQAVLLFLPNRYTRPRLIASSVRLSSWVIYESWARLGRTVDTEAKRADAYRKVSQWRLGFSLAT